MFDHRGTLKVTDFGIARDDPATATAMNPTHAGAFFGTPAFMAPEQAGHALAEGWPPIDAAADQYSLAAVLYEALTGQLTHDSGGGSVALCTRRMNEEARPLRDLAPTVPAEIEAVAMKALARDPSKRYATVEDFAVALGSAACSSLGPDWLGRSEVQLRDAGAILDAARGRGGGPLTLDVQPHVPRGRPRLMISTFAIALIVALASFVFLTRHDSPAPNGLHGSPIARFTNLPRRLTKAWSFVTGGGVFSSPAVSGDVVVVGSDDGSVYALDATTGKLRWKRTTGGPVRSSPVIAGGRVFVGSNDGSLYALDLTTGSVVWKAPIGYEIVSSPAVAGGVVVVGSDRLYAFDAATGASRWNFTPGKPIVSSPAIARGTVVVGSNDARVCGIDLSTGKERWHFPTGAGIQSSPAIADGVAYVGGLDGNLYAINISNGVSAWATDLGSPVKSSPVVSSGRVFVGTDAGRLDSIAVVGGKLQWSFNASDRVDSSPTVVGDIVAVGSDDNNVYAVASRTGTLEGAYQTSGAVLSSPHAVGSNIAVGSNDNKIYEISGLGARGS
jgi:outer membrane protein assembly factor BamB